VPAAILARRNPVVGVGTSRERAPSGSQQLKARNKIIKPASSLPEGEAHRNSEVVNTTILMREQRYHQIKAVMARLRLDSAARLVVLVDKDGQQIAVHGELGELDTTSLASLVAGNVAATGGMAKLIGEREFPTLSHEGERESIHISVIGRVLLVVVFDDRSSLGLVKLRSKQISQELAAAFAEIERDSESSSGADALPFDEITDEEIDSLFSQT